MENFFSNLSQREQWDYISEYCNDQARDDLYPYESLHALLFDWSVSEEDIWRLACENYYTVDLDDYVFIGDVSNEDVSSFKNWKEYLEVFMDSAGEDFIEWMKYEHPEEVDMEEEE